MSSVERYENFDQFSNWEHNYSKLQKKHKFKNICSFIEKYITIFYEVYKRNKNSNITFSDYRKLMLQNLAKHYNPGMNIFDPGENNSWKKNEKNTKLIIS